MLAVWQGDVVVAVCSWHLHEHGPPVIFDLGARTDLPPKSANRARTALLACLRDIAAHPEIRRDANSLRWSDRPLDRIPDRSDRQRVRGAVRDRAQKLGFRPMRPRPRWWRGRWAVERRF